MPVVESTPVAEEPQITVPEATSSPPVNTVHVKEDKPEPEKKVE